MTLTGKVAFVTGGSATKIGLAIARALLDRGAQVAITATSDSTLRKGAAELEAVSDANLGCAAYSRRRSTSCRSGAGLLIRRPDVLAGSMCSSTTPASASSVPLVRCRLMSGIR